MPEKTSQTDARLRVDFTQTWVVQVGKFIEAFPAEWEDAQRRGLDEKAFALESIDIMGEDVRDIAEHEDGDWEVMTL